ncbi:MAG: YkoP family protein [Chloroflexota bacterium]
MSQCSMKPIQRRSQAFVLRATSRLAVGSRGGRARGLLRVWRLWEFVDNRFWVAPPVPGASNGVLRLRVARFHGLPIELPDGTQVKRGDLVGELHMNNQKLAEFARERRWDVLIRLREDFSALAAWTQTKGFDPRVRAFYGVTMLRRGGPWLHLTVRDRPLTLRARFERLYMSGLLVIYSHAGELRVKRGHTAKEYPVEVWISRPELLRVYGSTEPVDGAAGKT